MGKYLTEKPCSLDLGAQLLVIKVCSEWHDPLYPFSIGLRFPWDQFKNVHEVEEVILNGHESWPIVHDFSCNTES